MAARLNGFVMPLIQMSEPQEPIPLAVRFYPLYVALGVLFGFIAGGHKDFRESMRTNIAWTIFDALWWTMAILAKTWRFRHESRIAAGRNEARVQRYLLVSYGAAVVALVAGAAFFLSLWIGRTALSDFW